MLLIHYSYLRHMKLSPLFILIFILFETHICVGQDVNWKNARNWKLYNIQDKAGFKYSLDTLNSFQSINLKNEIMQTFMSNVSEWPKEKYSMWMGLFIATCETEDKKLRKVIISNYGGFFYDQLTMRYYELPDELKSPWLELLNGNSKKNFINN